MDYSLPHEHGLGDHLGAPKQEVERGNNCRQRDTLLGISVYTGKT